MQDASQSNNTLIKNDLELIRVAFNKDSLTVSIEISLLLIAVLIFIVITLGFISSRLKKYKLVKLNISLGNIGQAELAPNEQDIQVAHQIWTELVTRKAALPLDIENDVLIEIYDSWYSLFTRVRELISEIPAPLVRNNNSTREIVHISTATLNDGLRPHLTKWQARFRNWYTTNSDNLNTMTPQELQREYPQYDELVSEMLVINQQLIEYASELKKIVNG